MIIILEITPFSNLLVILIVKSYSQWQFLCQTAIEPCQLCQFDI